MEYLKSFKTDADYQQFLGGGDFITPNVSAIENTDIVYYNPVPEPLLPRYSNYDFPLKAQQSWNEDIHTDNELTIMSVFKDIYNMYLEKYPNLFSIIIYAPEYEEDNLTIKKCVLKIFDYNRENYYNTLLFETDIKDEPLFKNWLLNVSLCVASDYYNTCANISNGFYIDSYGAGHNDVTLQCFEKQCDECPETETCCHFQYYWDGSIMGEVNIGGWGCP